MSCPKCGSAMVYSEHRTKDDKWRTFCQHCGYTTKEHGSRKEALKEFQNKTHKGFI